MTKSTFALIPTGKTVVENLIVATTDYAQDGYDLIEIKSSVYCSPGMFYNSSTGLFYQDEGYTTIYPVDSNSLSEQASAADSSTASSDEADSAS